MQLGDDYSLTHVVRQLKYFMQKIYGNLPSQPTEGNKKFEKILKQSHEDVIVMNANRQFKHRDYVHLKSLASPKEFEWVKKNLGTLGKIHQLQFEKSEKVDLNYQGQNITFDSDTKKWGYKSRRLLFRPNYEAVKNGQLFRISLSSQAKGTIEPKAKVAEMLLQAINKIFQLGKKEVGNEGSGLKYRSELKKMETIEHRPLQNLTYSKDKSDFQDPPLRFKRQETIILNDCCSIVISRVFQVVNLKLYQSIYQLVTTRKNSTDESLGKALLSSMVKEVFEDLSDDLVHEVEFRFNPEFIKELEGLHEEEVEDIMVSAADLFVGLVKDPKEFSAEEVVKCLQEIQGS